MKLEKLKVWTACQRDTIQQLALIIIGTPQPEHDYSGLAGRVQFLSNEIFDRNGKWSRRIRVYAPFDLEGGLSKRISDVRGRRGRIGRHHVEVEIHAAVRNGAADNN